MLLLIFAGGQVSVPAVGGSTTGIAAIQAVILTSGSR